MDRSFTPDKILYNQNLKNLKEEFSLFVSRESCLMRDEIYNTWLIDRGVKKVLCLPKGRTIEYYHEKRSWNNFLNKFAGELLDGKKPHLSRYPSAKKELLDSSRRLAAACRKEDQKKILSVYREYAESAYGFCEYIWAPWAVINKIEPLVLPKVSSPELVTSLQKPIEYFKMRLLSFQSEAGRLARQFAFLNVYNPADKPFTVFDVETVRKNSDLKSIKKQYKDFSRVARRFRTYAASLPKEQRAAAELVHAYAFLKTDRIDAWKRTMFCLADLCRYLSSICPVSFKEASFFTVNEIISLLSGRSIEFADLELRAKNKVAYVLIKGRIVVVSRSKSVENIIRGVSRSADKSAVVKGGCASFGKARGQAKIVLHSEDIYKIRKGDILVASYTFPSFVPFMKVCAAIITDEGGMTSHAAIVSRELGIPCVVGTKIATKVFKDGDLVEVDAERGIVRKIF